MGDTRDETGERRITVQHVRYAAAGLAFVAAAIHLFHPRRGLPRLAEIATVGLDNLAYDPRPLAFVLSGLAIIVGVNLVFYGVPRKWLYAAGMAMMVVYIGGYFAWHFSGHGGFLPGRVPNYHGEGPIEAAVSHLESYPWARAAIVTEVALFVVLAWLYLEDR